MSKYKPKVRSGWSFFFLVLTAGLILAAFGITVGIGASIKVPATDLNFSLGGSLGKKEEVKQILPIYLQNRITDNNTLFNHSTTLTIWLAEGVGIVVFGTQPEAPLADLNLNINR